ncbi:MAG: DUF86 domain-containing protein [Chlamydiae bacterium]|nr:DUF86 domain-containing protein [Chlamydiota bacterium]MBI3276425.1 DUF86 domain-containing protein [Chlamydiota bacterium]
MTSLLTINSKIEKLKEYLSYLKSYQKSSLQELENDYTLQGAVLHYLQLTIECTIDIGELLISELKLRKPEGAREVFKILAENKILPENFAQNFSPVAGFRNIIVHEYAEVDMKKVHPFLENDLEDFEHFSQYIAEYLLKRKF